MAISATVLVLIHHLHSLRSMAVNATFTALINANSGANLNLDFQPTNDHPYGRNKTNVKSLIYLRKSKVNKT